MRMIPFATSTRHTKAHLVIVSSHPPCPFSNATTPLRQQQDEQPLAVPLEGPLTSACPQTVLTRRRKLNPACLPDDLPHHPLSLIFPRRIMVSRDPSLHHRILVEDLERLSGDMIRISANRLMATRARRLNTDRNSLRGGVNRLDLVVACPFPSRQAI